MLRTVAAAVPAALLLPLLVLVLAWQPATASASLPYCDAELCSYWVSDYGNVSRLRYGEVIYVPFDPEDVTNHWQVTACGSVPGYPFTSGEFELFVVDDANLANALAGKPFRNCSCTDMDGDALGGQPTTSACATVQDSYDSDIDPNNDLQCMYYPPTTTDGVETVCSNVLLRCATPDANTASSTQNIGDAGGCTLGLSVQVVIPDPFFEWWDLEYIPIVFGFCVVIILATVLSRHFRRQRERARLRAIGSLLNNEHGASSSYHTGTIVAEGTIVDDTTIPDGVFVTGNPQDAAKSPVATYHTGGADEDIYEADVEKPAEPSTKDTAS